MGAKLGGTTEHLRLRPIAGRMVFFYPPAKKLLLSKWRDHYEIRTGSHPRPCAGTLQNAEDLTALEEARVQLLGKKGELTAILKTMGQLSPEERPVMGPNGQ